MKILALVLLTGVAQASSIFTGIFTGVPTQTQIEGVKLDQTGTFRGHTGEILVSRVGAALRTKKVTLFNFRVYVGELFVSHAMGFPKSPREALSALDSQNAVVMQLHFLREVDAKTVRNSLREALEANQVDVKGVPYQSLLDGVAKGGDMKEHMTLTIAGEKTKTAEEVTYEDGEGHAATVQGPPGFIHSIFSMWLGKPADSGVEKFQNRLFKE